MLEEAKFSNYRCLRDCSISFGPLTVLVGPNASGKSSVLAGIDPARVISQDDAWRAKETPPREVEVRLRFGDNRYITKTIGGSSRQGKWLFDPLSQGLHLDLNSLRSSNQVQEATRLAPNGGNLTNVFATLTRKQQIELIDTYTKLVPAFSDVNQRPLTTGNLHLTFQDRWKPDLWYAASAVSDGSMLILAFLVLQYQHPQVDLITIEEPERSLHPFLLGKLVELLRMLSCGELGPSAVQVVMATHSAELLDHLEPDEVRFLFRDRDDGATRVTVPQTDTPEWQNAFRVYEGSLGDIWLSGGMGGVPAAESEA